MRRREFFEEQKLKRMVYVFSITLVISIVLFLTVFVMYNKKLKEESTESLLNLGKMSDIVQNDELSEASSSLDKNIAKASNTVNTTNTAINKATNTVSNTVKNTSTNKTPVSATIQNQVNANTVNQVTNNVVEEKKELAFVAPVSGEITKDFATDTLIYSNTLEEWTTHSGIDIKADKTTIVVASEAGTVESIKNDPRYGLTVTINHGEGFKTIYSNLLTSEFVKENEVVEQGQTIGTVGDSASFEVADEAHLHFEMYKDGTLVNPNTIFEKNISELN